VEVEGQDGFVEQDFGAMLIIKGPQDLSTTPCTKCAVCKGCAPTPPFFPSSEPAYH
jgi:hypothetical protein